MCRYFACGIVYPDFVSSFHQFCSLKSRSVGKATPSQLALPYSLSTYSWIFLRFLFVWGVQQFVTAFAVKLRSLAPQNQTKIFGQGAMLRSLVSSQMSGGGPSGSPLRTSVCYHFKEQFDWFRLRHERFHSVASFSHARWVLMRS